MRIAEPENVVATNTLQGGLGHLAGWRDRGENRRRQRDEKDGIVIMLYASRDSAILTRPGR